jgi:hypothetical protein
VEAHSRPNQADEYWEKEYKMKDFSTYMMAGASGLIDIFPTKVRPSQSDVDGSMIHETGHILSQRTWGGQFPAFDSLFHPGWERWRKAEEKDGSHASAYAKTARIEDFSETLRLYYSVKGTPEAAEVRALMPERFKLIDELLNGPV